MEDNSNPRLWERTRHIRSHHDVCNHGTKEKCPQTHCVRHLILGLCYFTVEQTLILQ